jgi:tyrosinase
LSVNSNFYGDIHNQGHNMVSLIHDPDNRYMEAAGVMGDTATAMRDPFFYRWHAFIDDVFNDYKKTLPPYSKDELAFDGE